MTDVFHHHLTDGHAFTITDASGKDIQVGAGWAVMTEAELQRLLAIQARHSDDRFEIERCRKNIKWLDQCLDVYEKAALQYDARVSGLLEANNREVERRQKVERAAEKLLMASRALVNFGVSKTTTSDALVSAITAAEAAGIGAL